MGMLGVQNSCGNSRGMGRGVILVVKKMEILGRRGGGGLHEIPSVVGVWIFSRATQFKQ